MVDGSEKAGNGQASDFLALVLARALSLSASLRAADKVKPDCGVVADFINDGEGVPPGEECHCFFLDVNA